MATVSFIQILLVCNFPFQRSHLLIFIFYTAGWLGLASWVEWPTWVYFTQAISIDSRCHYEKVISLNHLLYPSICMHAYRQRCSVEGLERYNLCDLISTYKIRLGILLLVRKRNISGSKKLQFLIFQRFNFLFKTFQERLEVKFNAMVDTVR